MHHARQEADKEVYKNIDPKSSELYRLANQFRKENADVVGDKPVKNDAGEMSMSDDSKQKAWLEHYQRLLNAEFDWDPNHLSDESPVEGPPIPITIDMVNREPDKLRIFVNYALKTPEYECLSNFRRITYCCQFSAYARGFVLFRNYESHSGDAEFRDPGRKKPVRTLIIPFRGFPRTCNFSGWTSMKAPKVSVLTSCKVATRWSYLGLNYKRYRQSISDRKCNLSFQLTPSSLVAGHVSVFHTFLIVSS